MIPQPPDRVGALLDSLSSEDDRLWPHERWPAMRLDRALGVEADGGHAFVRYRVAEYEPGRRIRFEIHGPPGFTGHHEARLQATECGTLLSHTIDGNASLRFLPAWVTAVRPLHDALIEDCFDKAERELGTLGPPQRWSWWVRILRRVAAGGRR